MSLAAADVPGTWRVAEASRQDASWPRLIHDFDQVSWPIAAIGAAMSSLAGRAGLTAATDRAPMLPVDIALDGDENFARWVYWSADRIGIGATLTDSPSAALPGLLTRAAPAILTYGTPEGRRLLLLLGVRLGRARLIGPDGRIHGCRLDQLRRLLTGPPDPHQLKQIGQMLDLAGLKGADRAAALGPLIDDRQKDRIISGILLLTVPATADFAFQLRHAGAHLRVLALIGMLALGNLVEILAWTIMGTTIVEGRLDYGWFGAWALALMSMVPIRFLGGWLNLSLGVEIGARLKARLLEGSLRTDLDQLRRSGAGELLARVMEAQAFETMAVSGGLSALTALIDCGLAAAVLSRGAAGPQQMGLFLVMAALAIGLAIVFRARLAVWTDRRSRMTHRLVERMAGHRTMLAQDRGLLTRHGEDADLDGYLAASRRLDGVTTPFVVAVPALWTIVALAGLAPTFLAGETTAATLAISIGGMLFAGRALAGLTSGASIAVRAGIAWDQMGDLFRAGFVPPGDTPFVPLRRDPPPGAMPAAGTHGPNGAPPALVELDDLTYTYPGKPSPVLSGVDLQIGHGERILLEGRSGGGKSTLAALLTGVRRPSGGLLLVNTLDAATLGKAWHDHITAAPQFHENHIFSAPLAFNLLMARGWPASADELEEAHRLCLDLGLGPLLCAMPAGIMQMVGETGWQLSHGERSRVFLARALLQDAPLTILDESFAALDPATLKLCVDCAFRRARALIVIAHP